MMQRLCPRRLGSLVQANARRLVLLLSLALLILCAATNSAKFDVQLSSWIHRTTRVENELQAIESALGDGAGSNSLLLLQTPRHTKNNHLFTQPTNQILSVESMMIHLEALAIATHVTIDLFDVSWSLKDICLAPTPPDYEGLIVNQMLDHLMPCVIKSPLDCFWEGAKLLGPEQDVRLSSLGPKLKWTNLDPVFMIETQQRNHPHASFPYQTLLSWMRRVGITTGYLDRPCLDPTDPNCPASAPNKLSGEAPDVGKILTGGCRGLATKQMHWKEEELVGGARKNKSGHIVGAEALQSQLLLMGERDIYDYWRKTSKVQDINNWSSEKAKLVLVNWQRRFKEELAQFTRSSMATNAFKIHALTPKSMLEPIDSSTVSDLTNFQLAAAFMTILTCIVFPKFSKPSHQNNSYQLSSNKEQSTFEEEHLQNNDNCNQETSVDRFKLTLLALSISTVVILTLIASFGLSSFINLPFNLATTQILPPLALFYGFRQALMIANIYSEYFEHTSNKHLTSECLLEIVPIIVSECTNFIIPLIVATAFPVQGTRVFTLQAIVYILMSSLMAILFIPSLLCIFLKLETQDEHLIDVKYSEQPKSRCRSISPGIISIISRKGSGKSLIETKQCPSVEEQIFSRLQDDLKNIKPESRRATDINFSARFGPDGLRTSFSLRTPAGSCYQQAMPENEYKQRDLKTPEPSFGLPDLLLRPDALGDGNFSQKTSIEEQDKLDKLVDDNEKADSNNHDVKEEEETEEVDDEDEEEEEDYSLLARGVDFLTRHKFLQLVVIVVRGLIIVAILSQATRVKFGLHLRDLLLKGTSDYESLMIREKYFPVYNIFAITKGGLDYPSNQKLLYELYDRISNVEGILRDEHGLEQKFWLVYFRDWLLEMQESFDQERNRSAISREGWTDDASDAAKLAYKLLAQTGKIDNPIDKNLVESNRLVDKNGIINQRAFYYYLTAWVMNDAFTYSSSEADFRPEPKTWYDNPNDLRIDRARPLTHAQIPFLLKLPEEQDNMKSVLDLANFPTEILFVFFYGDGVLRSRIGNSICRRFRTVIISLVLLIVTTTVLYNSKIDFMAKFSRVILSLILVSLFNYRRSVWSGVLRGSSSYNTNAKS